MKKRILSLLIVIALIIGVCSISAFADQSSAVVAPFTTSVGEITEKDANGYSYYDMVYDPSNPDADSFGYIYPQKTSDLYTISVPYGTQEITLSFLEERIAYGYDSSGSYINSCAADANLGYANNGQTGEMNAIIRSLNIQFADYIRVQTPYTDIWESSCLYAIKVDCTTSGSINTATQTNMTVNELLTNISANYVDNSSEWVVMDMAAYSITSPNAISKTSNSAIQKYIDSAIESIVKNNVSDSDCDKAILALTSIGADVNNLYPKDSNTTISAIAILNSLNHSTSAWTAPYTLAAYAQGNYGTTAYENALIDSILAAQKPDGSWDEWGTIDPTANVIAALSLYTERSGVQNAIDNAIEFLSVHQKDNGDYDDGQVGEYAAGSNSNSTAMVIIGLVANGINPATDSRFIKNGHSLLDGLLSFALPDGSGFGYTDNNTINTLSTEQGFRALIAASQIMTTGLTYNIYDFSSLSVTSVHATGSVQNDNPGENSGDDISVYVTINADTGYWMNNKTVIIPGTRATVYHALVSALANSGITQVGASNGYVKSMTKDGRTLEEFGSGAGSGWLFKVNGNMPNTGITTCHISNGDSILLYYTGDWTQDSSAAFDEEPTNANTTKTVITTETAITMPFTDISETDWFYDYVQKAYQRKLFDGVDGTSFAPSITFSRGMLATVLFRHAGMPKVELTKGFIDVTSGSWYSDGASWAQAAGIFDGYPDGRFDPDGPITREQMALVLMRYSQYINLDVSELSTLEAYNDVNSINDWALIAMKWANAAGIIEGAENSLNPTGASSRAEAATMLVRFLEKYNK